MLGRKIFVYLILIGTVGQLAIGCKKSSPQQTTENPTAQPQTPPPTAKAETVARVHWLGKRRLATETNAALFMSIWGLPESQKLEGQTLDKLALAPWNLPREGTNTASIVATNANSLLLRPLLEDLVQEECYLEIRGNTLPRAGSARADSTLPGADMSRADSTTEIALAVRLEDARSRLWKTNLTSVLDSLKNQAPVLRSAFGEGGSPTTNHPIFLRTANWTVICILPRTQSGRDPANLGQGGWMTELAGRLGQNSNLFTAETNSWLEAEVDLDGISQALGLGWNLPKATPKVSFSVGAEGELVRTIGRLNFNSPLPLNLDEWQVPTNLVHDPVTSFTAIRGIKSLLSFDLTWNSLQLGPPPNQLYVWGQGSLPITTFWAAPAPDASNHIYQFTEHLIKDVNPWLTTNSMGQFQRTTNANAAIWGGLPFMEPYLRSVTLPEGSFIMGGVGAAPLTNRPAPSGLFEQFLSRTNLVYYDWELTGARLEPSLYNIQFLRFAFHKSQVPPDSVSVAWLRALEPKLANSATLVALTSPDVFSFVRRSSIGVTGVELQVITDWLESPQFPKGLNTFTAPPPPLKPHHGTNAVSAAPKEK
jgi:hypothetical protein